VHDTWARVYDFIYDECFGATFTRLTDATLALVERTQPPPARILDLGAGTGRLAIPLALRGYDLTAVERSHGMANTLAERARHLAAPLVLRRGDFRDLDAVLGPLDGTRAADAAPFDIALAVFTVVNYLVAEDDVAALARGTAERLRPGGHVVLDLAERRLFASALFESERLHREIEVTELAPDVFRYRDAGCGVCDGERFQYDDLFTLRYWRPDDLLWIFARHGLTVSEDATGPLRASGSCWFVLEKGA
jgi:SAM-dependent methyltransferase